MTGLGAITPLGLGIDASWQALCSGRSAATTLRPSQIDHWTQLRQSPGMKLHGAPVSESFQDSMQRIAMHQIARQPQMAAALRAWSREPMVAMAVAAMNEAFRTASLAMESIEPARTSVIFGSSKGGLRTAEQLCREQHVDGNALPCKSDMRVTFDELGSAAASRAATVTRSAGIASNTEGLWEWAFASDSATQAMARILGVRGAMSCPIAACATGLIALLQGAFQIASGACDVCVVGSSDAALRASVISSFHRLRVTSRHDDPRTACRPFDETRDGFVIGEGAAVMILESREHLQKRRGRAFAKVLGGGWLSDPTGMTQVDESGAVVQEVIQRSVDATCVVPSLISVHGTGTESNDLAESRGISRTPCQSALCFGMKGSLGHLLGAAGSVETALSLYGLSKRQHAGTTNLNQQDSRCPISIARHPGQVSADAVLGKLSLGFGGHTAFGMFCGIDGR